MLNHLLSRDGAYSEVRDAEDPGYFARLAPQQAPGFFWIGYPSGRVRANVEARHDLGEVLVHRNVANVVHSPVMNLLSSLKFAVGLNNGRLRVLGCTVGAGHFGREATE